MTARWRLLSLGALLAGLFALVTLSGALSTEEVRDRLDGFGLLGPLVFVCVSALLTPALFPGPLLAGAAGLLFGTALGTPVAIVSATLGATLAFCLGRWWAHDAVEELARGRVAALRAWIGRRGFYAVLYARLAPGIPYSLVNYAAGLSPIRLSAFAGATAIGCAPRAFAYAALGGNLDDLGSPEAIAALVVLVAMALGGLIGLRIQATRTAPEPGPPAAGPRAPSGDRS